MKKIIVFLLLIFLFSTPVFAMDNYQTQLENIGAADIENALDKSTKEFFEENGINITNSDWANNLTNQSVLQHIGKFITSGFKRPVVVGITITGVIFLYAALTAFGTYPHFEIGVYAVVISIGAIISTSIWQSISAAVNAAKGCSSFMLSFVPVFATAIALSGKSATATSMSALLLAACEIVSYASSFIVLPLMGGYLAISISSGVSPLINSSDIVEGVKKFSLWILSLLGTLFIGVLGIQTAINSAADSVSLRAAKFILGTSVPVAGGVLSEAVSTISASMGLIRSSVGIYGVVAILFMLLPIVTELVMWRCVLMINMSLGELFTLPKITRILKAIDSMISLLIGVVLTVGGVFIISLTVVIMAGK